MSPLQKSIQDFTPLGERRAGGRCKLSEVLMARCSGHPIARVRVEAAMSNKNTKPVPTLPVPEQIKRSIVLLRGHKVMLDFDLPGFMGCKQRR